MSNAIEGYGAKLQYSLDGIVFTDVAEVCKIGGPNLEVKSIEITHLLSPQAFREFMAGVVDAGEFSAELNFTATQMQAFLTLIRVMATWSVTFSDTSTWVVDGFIHKLGDECPFDDKVSMTCTIKLTGVPSFQVTS